MYFFHLATPRHLIPDEEGMELADLEAARKEAAASARDIIAELMEEDHDVSGFAFNVVDEAGQQVLLFEFKPLLDGGSALSR